MNRTFLLITTLTIIFVALSTAHAALLGQAQDYNVFVFETLDVNTSDSKGRMAAGGNINYGYPGISSGYTVGDEADPSAFSIVGGADVNFYRGSVLNGGIFAEGNVYLDHYSVFGDVVANGSISYGPGGGTIVSPGTANPNAGATSPIDFTAAEAYLTSTSDTLNSMAVNGVTLVQYDTNITFTGTDDVNIFSLAGSDLNNANVINFNMGIDDVAVINVSGVTGDHFTTLGFTGTYQQSNILWNFYESTDLTLNTTVQGSILAPYADVTFNSGNLWGTLVAESMTGTGEFHFPPFNPNVTVVPEPVSSTLFVAGGAALGFRRFRKKRKTA